MHFFYYVTNFLSSPPVPFVPPPVHVAREEVLEEQWVDLPKKSAEKLLILKDHLARTICKDKVDCIHLIIYQLAVSIYLFF